MDLFLDYLQNGDSLWHTRALTDRSMMAARGLTEAQTNVTLATYGDAVLKLVLCELLLDRVEELTIEKSKYESDISLVRIAAQYRLLDYLIFDRANSHIPKDYGYRKIEHGVSKSKKSKLRQYNARRKYIATAMEALLGAMYRDGYTLAQIQEIVYSWTQRIDAMPQE